MGKHCLQSDFIIILQSLLLLQFIGCGQLPDYRSIGQVDLKPPAILKIIPTGDSELEILFDEPLLEKPELNIAPDLEITNITIDETRVIIKTTLLQQAGIKYAVQGMARDRKGNSLTFLYSFYGYNPTPPLMIINEFTTQGSSKHPDLIELKVIEGGNCAGIIICEGTTDYPEDRYIFPPLEVRKGEFLLIHFKPRGIPEEIDETGNTDVSGGYDASSTCRDFWVEGGNGLGGNNGTLTLYNFPEGPLMDGVLYSNRTSVSDTDYRGFGSIKMMNKADQLCEEGGWLSTGELAAPEDGINPDDSTATRSMCRSPGEPDTDRSGDWHITPTSGYSFGGENTNQVYSP